MGWRINNMPIKCSEIKGFLVEKVNPNCEEPTHSLNVGYNQAIDQQGEVKLGLNREKLALTIQEYNEHRKANPGGAFYTFELADAIIAKENEIIEVALNQ